MVKLTLDSALFARLGTVGKALEICDAAGRTVGYFHPSVNQPAIDGRLIRSPFSDEELQQRQQQRMGRPLAEILEKMESLRK